MRSVVHRDWLCSAVEGAGEAVQERGSCLGCEVFTRQSGAERKLVRRPARHGAPGLAAARDARRAPASEQEIRAGHDPLVHPAADQSLQPVEEARISSLLPRLLRLQLAAASCSRRREIKRNSWCRAEPSSVTKPGFVRRLRQVVKRPRATRNSGLGDRRASLALTLRAVCSSTFARCR